MALFRKLALLFAVVFLAAPALAQPVTPPNLGTAGSINNGDLMLEWPCPVSCGSGGPLQSIPFSTVKAAVTAGLTGTFAQLANNLSDLTSAAAARTNLGLGTAAVQATTFFLQKANNLSDLASSSTARTNLGVTATGADTTYAFRSNNLSDLASASSARTNLGLGSAATQASSTFLQTSNNLSDVPSPSTARANLGVPVAPTYAQFTQQQTSGTAPGDTISATAWSQRVLNTTIVNTIAGASLASNQISLPAGTYEVEASAQVGEASVNGPLNHRLRIRDITDSTTLLAGQNYNLTTVASTTVQLTATLVGQFTLSGTKTVELDSWVNGAGSPTGGLASSTGEVEVYDTIYLRKVA